MPRSARGDAPGVWHHVMNRGLARRTLFETERDIRYFLSRLAREVRAGRLEVHAYCVLTTHFHLLVRSPCGKLAEAMRRIQNEYVRWFNRTRRRDGTIYRGRYRSRPVDSLEYQQMLVRYIDSNPMRAGLVRDPRLHPHGSARWYAREAGPIWLTREWVERTVQDLTGVDRYRPEDYPRVFGGALRPSLAQVVERRLERGSCGDDPLRELLGAAPEAVRDWMRRKAALADGTGVGDPCAAVADVIRLVDRSRAQEGSWQRGSGARSSDLWVQVQVALLRDLCGLTFAEAGLRSGVTEGGAWNLYRKHRTSMEDERYAARAAALARGVMSAYGVGATSQRSGLTLRRTPRLRPDR